jgi:hypothetical protein
MEEGSRQSYLDMGVGGGVMVMVVPMVHDAPPYHHLHTRLHTRTLVAVFYGDPYDSYLR